MKCKMVSMDKKIFAYQKIHFVIHRYKVHLLSKANPDGADMDVSIIDFE